MRSHRVASSNSLQRSLPGERGKSASAPHAEYLDLAGTGHCTISGHGPYSLSFCVRSVRSFYGLIHPGAAVQGETVRQVSEPRGVSGV